jgi:8-oxo-dGTP diphosphatase
MERPKVGLGVIIIKDDKVLMGQRLNTHGSGSWSFPGGHLEFGESYEDCAHRETFEEAGIKIKNLSFVTATNDYMQSENKHYITVYILAEYASGDVTNKEPDKLSGWDWFTWDNFPNPLFLPIQNLLKLNYNPFPLKQKFQHYKGHFYELIGEGKHSDTLEEYVIYKGLYDSKDFGRNPLWVKTKSGFQENIKIAGEKIPRFKRIK